MGQWGHNIQQYAQPGAMCFLHELRCNKTLRGKPEQRGIHADYLQSEGMQHIAYTPNTFPEHLGSDLTIDYFYFMCENTCIVLIRLCIVCNLYIYGT